ncbi:TonB-dependent receptor [Sphingobium amiense]|uniref:TonB-dependent receptor n=1 Tax=Sphingobium amiense TaxID=135719 RepID=A0A494W5L6_9SPHN|nr:TonB-dependent receptor [Sphingobium amiense]BBD99873.1 TonB-dependent receptor [Sphingobium amiense]
MTRHSQMAILLAATALAGAANPALAQDADGAPPSSTTAENAQSAPRRSEGSLLDDIIVTAQKKSKAEEAQRVPIALTAFSGAQIETMHVTTLRDMGTYAPNVALEPNGTIKGLANFTVRGLGANTATASVEPSVGLFVNGIYQGVNGGQVLDNFDIESVEILRGPQGTLFGRNVTGGAVVVRTARPTKELSGRFQVDYSTGDTVKAAATVSGPIVGDAVLAKLTVYRKHDGGWFYNQTLRRHTGGDNTWFVRPTIQINIAPGVEQTFIFQHLEQKGDGIVSRNIYLNPRKFQITQDYAGYTDISATDFTSETNIDVGFGNGRITNLFGYRKLHQASGRDFDSGPTLINHAQDNLNQDQYSNELRYAGSFGSLLDLTTGLFLFKQHLFATDRRDLAGGAITEGGGSIDQKGWGVFGQADVHVTPTLTATAGLRYSWEEKEAHVARSSGARPCNLVTQICNFNGADALNAKKSWNALTPHFGLQWQATPDVMAYASYSKGVRSGGYNVRRASAADPGVFDQEDLDSFEAGVKSKFFDRRARLNLSGFYTKLKGMILNGNFNCTINPTTCPTGVVSTLFNAADAKIYGLEAELVVAPVDGLELIANVGRTKGEYIKVLTDLNKDGIINAADKNRDIPRVAPWSYNLGGTYTLGLGDAGKIAFHTDYGYRSRSFLDEANLVPMVKYRRWNADITYTVPDGSLSISGYVTNLNNREQNSASTPVVPGVAYYYVIDKGRVWGGSLNYRF